MRISQPKWRTYVEVQQSGETNMFDINKVVELSKKISETPLNRQEVIWIMKHYGQLRQAYGISGGINIEVRSIKGEGGKKDVDQSDKENTNRR